MFIIEKLAVHTSEDKQKKTQFIIVQHTSGHVKVSTVYDHHSQPTLLCTWTRCSGYHAEFILPPFGTLWLVDDR
jgi:hypothetical protein